MSKARDIANILSANTAIATDAEVSSAVSAAVSTHATAANGHIGRGTTQNRPVSATVGDFYFDTTLNSLMVYKSAGWEKASQDPAPQIASISPTTAATTGTVVTITGSSFKSGLSVDFIGTNSVSYTSPLATFVGATTVTATTPNLPVEYEPYDVKVINNDNQFAVLQNCLDSGGTPIWSTASGNIANVFQGSSLSVSVSATDPDGTSIIYSSTDLPVWASINSSTGQITGTAPVGSSDTTHSFTVVASDGVNTSSRSFNVVSVYGDGSSSARAFTSSAALKQYASANGYYWVNINGTPTQIYSDITADSGLWYLVAFAQNGKLSGRLNASNGTYVVGTRGTNTANLNAVNLTNSSSRIAFAWNQSGTPNGGILSYDNAVSFATPSNTMSLDGSLNPSVANFQSNVSDPQRSSFNISILKGASGFSASDTFYTRKTTFSVNYGNSYGIVKMGSSGNQLDWGPDGQTFASVYLSYVGAASEQNGYITHSGTQNGFVPSTLSMWVKVI
jgi:hypothetical protein